MESKDFYNEYFKDKTINADRIIKMMEEYKNLCFQEAIKEINKHRDSITKPSPSSNFFAEDLKPFGKGYNVGTDSAIQILKEEINGR